MSRSIRTKARLTYEPVDEDTLWQVGELGGGERHANLVVPRGIQQLQRLTLLVEGVAGKSRTINTFTKSDKTNNLLKFLWWKTKIIQATHNGWHENKTLKSSNIFNLQLCKIKQKSY